MRIENAQQVAQYIIQRADRHGWPINCAKLVRILYLVYSDWAKEYGEPLFDGEFDVTKNNMRYTPVYLKYVGYGSLSIWDFGTLVYQNQPKLDKMIDRWSNATLHALIKQVKRDRFFIAACGSNMQSVGWEFFKEQLDKGENQLNMVSELMRTVSVESQNTSYKLTDVVEIITALAKAYEDECNARDREVSLRMELERENEKLKAENEGHRAERLTEYCDCYRITNGQPRCYGTKEMNPCDCDGRKSRCSFYKETRKKYEKFLHE